MASRLRNAGYGLTVAGALAVGFVGGKEGVSTKAYRDIVGVPTICFGETRGVKMGDTATMDECKAMLGDALVEFEDNMRACLTNPDKIPDKPYVSFLSLSYNIGSRAFCRSTVARKANAGDLVGACNAILAWNMAGGRVIKGLTLRRQEERRMCLEGA
ncbi:lysozyme [Rhizobium phaseoli]|uniref:Lysozyme n=1 Tax=Rhizobium phaseoli TaxID=396 RepID=A0ABN4QGT3_9HYPH|nr:lysozyme [Rhizobium phaseoli]ANL84689.1 phage-related lysozyme protein [Rhizobium phaseoli]ANL91196.1 phage-related lysozyme protein [Rhizobium phaseoli]